MSSNPVRIMRSCKGRLINDFFEEKCGLRYIHEIPESRVLASYNARYLLSIHGEGVEVLACVHIGQTHPGTVGSASRALHNLHNYKVVDDWSVGPLVIFSHETLVMDDDLYLEFDDIYQWGRVPLSIDSYNCWVRVRISEPYPDAPPAKVIIAGQIFEVNVLSKEDSMTFTPTIVMERPRTTDISMHIEYGNRSLTTRLNKLSLYGLLKSECDTVFTAPVPGRTRESFSILTVDKIKWKDPRPQEVGYYETYDFESVRSFLRDSYASSPLLPQVQSSVSPTPWTQYGQLA